MGLSYLKNNAPDLSQNPDMLSFVQDYTDMGFISILLFVGIGTVLTVLALLLTAGYNNTAYYPSNTDIQSSLTLANSCSSQFTLKTMAYVSILVPFVIAYIFYAWRSIDNRKIDAKAMDEGGHAY